MNLSKDQEAEMLRWARRIRDDDQREASLKWWPMPFAAANSPTPQYGALARRPSSFRGGSDDGP